MVLRQEVAREQAEALASRNIIENQEAALKELGRLLEFTRREASCAADGKGDDRSLPLDASALTGRHPLLEESSRFARVMVRHVRCLLDVYCRTAPCRELLAEATSTRFFTLNEFVLTLCVVKLA